MLSKWIIEGLDGYVFGEDKKLYRLPHESHGKYYGIKELKKQYPNRYLIDGRWWSERQLLSKVKLDSNPVHLYFNDEMPF